MAGRCYALSAWPQYHELAQCVADSLRVGLTTPADFHYGIVDDFEDGDLAKRIMRSGTCQ